MRKIVSIIFIVMFAGLFIQSYGLEEKQNNVFNPNQVKIGDRVSGLKIIYIKKIESEDEKIYEIYFKGKKIISGKYEYNDKNDQFCPNTYAFYPDETSAKLLPVMDFETRMVWFIFSNNIQDEKFKKLKGKSGKAVIEIEDFQIFYYPSELSNKASLTQIINLGN